MDKLTCPYCQQAVRMRSGYEIYPHRPDLADINIWCCDNCDARVGTHLGTTKPLGVLANKELRDLRVLAHSRLDALWQSPRLPGRNTRRTAAYSWMQKVMGLSKEQAHIGLFTIEQCTKLIEAVAIKGKDNG